MLLAERAGGERLYVAATWLEMFGFLDVGDGRLIHGSVRTLFGLGVCGGVHVGSTVMI